MKVDLGAVGGNRGGGGRGEGWWSASNCELLVTEVLFSDATSFPAES